MACKGNSYLKMVKERRRRKLEYIHSLGLVEQHDDFDRNSYLKTVEENRKKKFDLLRSLGMVEPGGTELCWPKEATETDVKPEEPKKIVKKQPQHKKEKLCRKGTRQSPRLMDKIPETVTMNLAKKEEKKVGASSNRFGAIPGVPVGTLFKTRLEASRAGIHRPPVAGIHGSPDVGCYSVAVSGGYEDDEDSGFMFVYTGAGGRDLKGVKAKPKNLRIPPQSKNQVLKGPNLALAKNVETGLPVRVLRGPKTKSAFAPAEGYRYDGLYHVSQYFMAKGKSGFDVVKFRLMRIEKQPPAPWL